MWKLVPTLRKLMPACLLLAACAGPRCGAGAPALRAELLFGLPGSDAAFQDFLARQVTPLFPAGLTVLPGRGQWTGAGGGLTREESRVLLIVAPDTAETLARLDAIRAAYKREARQESVGLVLTGVCADF